MTISRHRPPPPSPARRWAPRARPGGALVAVALAVVWLLAAALPAGAVSDYGLESPGGTVTGVTAVVAYVNQSAAEAAAERIDRVETRFVRDGAQVGSVAPLEFTGQDVREDGRISRYRASLDPLQSGWTGGEPMANGSYQLEVRVISRLGEAPAQASGWRQRQVVLDVPPPQTRASAKLVDPVARTVEVNWSPVGAGLPDFRRYVIERSTNGGDWSEVRRITGATRTSDTDTVGDGEHRYRVTVVRASGSGGELSSEPSAPSGPVQTGAPPGPGQPGAPAGPGGPGDVAPGGAPGAPPDAPPNRLGFRRGGSAGPQLRPGDSAPPRIVTPGAQAPVAAPPAGGPAPEGGFEEILPYGDLPADQQVIERELVAGESGMDDGGTLTIFNRQLVTRDVVVPIAGGLVLVLTAAHLRRFLNQSAPPHQ